MSGNDKACSAESQNHVTYKRQDFHPLCPSYNKTEEGLWTTYGQSAYVTSANRQHTLFIFNLPLYIYIYINNGRHVYSDGVLASMAVTYSIWEVDNCTSNPALALNERTTENLGGKEVVINCLHIKGSWAGLLMNHPPAVVHKRFLVLIYIRWWIYTYILNVKILQYTITAAVADAHFQNMENWRGCRTAVI